MNALRLLLRAARVEVTLLAVLAVLTAASAALAVAAPQWWSTTVDDALRARFAAAAPQARDVTFELERVESAVFPDASSLRAAEERLLAAMPEPLRSSVGRSSVAVRTGRYAMSRPTPRPDDPPRELSLTLRPDLADAFQLVAGRLPGPARVPLPPGATPRTGLVVPGLEVALTPAVATALDLDVGDVAVLSPSSDTGTAPLTAVSVVGLVVPRAPDASSWAEDPAVPAPAVYTEPGLSGRRITLGTALLGPEAVAALGEATQGATRHSWRYELDPAALRDPLAGGLTAAVTALERSGVEGIAGADRPPAVPRTGIDDLLRRHGLERRAAAGLLSVVAAALAALAVGVLALAARLAAARWSPALLVAAARGASPLALGLASATLALLPAAAGVAAGAALAVALVPGPPGWLPALLAAGVLAAAVLPVAVLGAVRARDVRGGAQGSRLRRSLPLLESLDRLRSPALGGVLLVVALAAASAYLLRRRGITASGAAAPFDPLLAAVPALVALAAALLLLAAYPLPLRALARLAARTRGAVAFVGLARAGRAGRTDLLPVVVLLLAVGLAVHAGVVLATVDDAQQRSAWQVVGAAARIDGPGAAALADRVRGLPGVQGVVPARLAYSVPVRREGRTVGRALALAVPWDDFGRLQADLPLPAALPAWSGGTGGTGEDGAATAPVVAGAGLPVAAGEQVDLLVGSAPLVLRVADVRTAFPGVTGASFVVLPDAVVPALGEPSRLYVRGSPDPDALRAAVDGAEVVEVGAVRAALVGSPLSAGVVDALHAEVAVAVAYAVLTVALAAVLAARRRTAVLGRLRTLGLGRGQAGGLVALELGPLVLVSALAGAALGVALGHLLNPGIDLSPLTGPAPSLVRVDAVGTAALLTGLVALLALTVLAATLAAARAGLARLVRIGDAMESET